MKINFKIDKNLQSFVTKKFKPIACWDFKNQKWNYDLATDENWLETFWKDSLGNPLCIPKLQYSNFNNVPVVKAFFKKGTFLNSSSSYIRDDIAFYTYDPKRTE